MKQKYYYGAVLGYPILYSLSPNLYNDYFKKNDINFFYNAIEINKNSIVEFIKDVEKYGYRFFNITQPLKEEILNISSISDDVVKKTENGNLIIYLENINQWRVFNTDYFGFSESYGEIFSTIVLPKVALVGTGSVAKTVFSYLKDNFINNIDVFSVTGRPIPDFFRDKTTFKIYESSEEIKNSISFNEKKEKNSDFYDILIFASSHLHETFFNFDDFKFAKMISLNYQSEFLDVECKKRNIPFFSGKNMLIKQFEKNIEILKEFNIF